MLDTERKPLIYIDEDTGKVVQVGSLTIGKNLRSNTLFGKEEENGLQGIQSIVEGALD
jgi:hypothetical protein